MVLPGHIAGGYLATKALLVLSHASLTLTSAQTSIIYLVGIISAELPDSDLIWFYFVHKLKLGNDQSRRDYLTHAPFVYLVASLLIVAAGSLFDSTFTEMIGWAFLVGSWSHFILDSIEYGIMWIWPFSHKRFALIKVPEEIVENEKAGTFRYYWQFIKNVYVKRITFYSEILILIIALIAFFK